MPLLRHIAGVPTATEQRCVRCCEVIQSRGQLRRIGASIGDEPYWPSQEVNGGTFPGDGEIEDCKPVDLSALSAREYPVLLAPGKYSEHKSWGNSKLSYPCGHCGMSFQYGNHIGKEHLPVELL